MSERVKIIVAFGIVYVVWGSTYLAIRVGVQDLPSSLLAAGRFLPGGLLLLLALAGLKQPVLPARRDLGALSASAVLLLVGGNGLVIYAEKTVPSGLAALVVATVPLWVAVLEGVLPGGERIAWRGLAGVALGLAGLAVLSWPELVAGGTQAAQPLGIGLLLVASLSWAAGTLLMRRRQVALSPLAVTGWQMFIGGLVHVLLALALQRGEPVTLSPRALLAVAYLIVFGSWLGYSAYVWLVHHVPAAKVSTYAYVNPAIAVVLGWVVLGEPIDGYVLAGMAVILLAVALVNSAHVARAPAMEPALPAAEEPAD